jgi:DNA-binding CsgD family transcriptional regulator/tetratricopeptide (TPR) repeat protein
MALTLPLGEPMTKAEALDGGQESFGHRAWADAYAQLSIAARDTPLELEDLERLAVAAYLTGRDAESEAAWTHAHHQSLRLGDWGRAAWSAFSLGMVLINRGEMAQGAGWWARAQRVLDEHEHDCVERGWLLIPLGLRRYAEGDFAGSQDAFRQAGEVGASYGDSDLVPIARHAEGRALIRLGRTAEGVALLDEAMVAVTAGEVSPIPAGIIYCGVIEACQEIFDVRRAQEWTAALTDWCATQPDLVPYRGRCRVHRAEIMQLHGAWRDAMDEARRACEPFSEPPQPQLAAAFYQRAELHRLRGDFAEAETAYSEASQRGRTPEPGLAQLRLAQGRLDAAAVSIHRALDEAKDLVGRSKMLPAYVEIMLATADLRAARAAADELSEIAANLDAQYLRGLAACVQGAVFLAESDGRAALDALGSAMALWEELGVPYETARLRVLVGLACRERGDVDGAEMELDAARRVFRQLGAAPDLARVEALVGTAVGKAPAGLTAREVQVLALVAAGKSNREIAADLVISDRTVARHMSNIFAKLSVSSRTAATAFAFEHDLV